VSTDRPATTKFCKFIEFTVVPASGQDFAVRHEFVPAGEPMFRC